MKQKSHILSSDKISIYETTMPLLESLYGEFKDLSKKTPDAAVNKSKINIVNRLLKQVRVVLAEEESINFLDVLDENDIPQVSDVVLILSQYVAAMNSCHEKYSPMI